MKHLLKTSCALFAFALAGCAAIDSEPQFRRLHVNVADTHKTLPAATRLAVTLLGPDGARHEANGVASEGATVRTLCSSLRRSMVARGCNAVTLDVDPDADDLPRAMRQIVALPAGWSMESARVSAKTRGSSTVTVSMENVR